VAATRISWFNTGVDYGDFDDNPTNSGLGYEYVRRLADKKPAGEALYLAKKRVNPSSCSAWLMNWFDFNLLGDPSLPLIP
jgi:hypothetical protein